MIPDFPRAAELFRTMYQKRFGLSVDGVIATDPVALSYILTATGPVDLPPGPARAAGVTQLTASNAVSFLLSKAYAIGTSDQAHAVFAQSARAVFGALMAGQGSDTALVRGLYRAAGEHRILVWSADAGEQSLLASTAVGGALPSADGSSPTVGVFLNDADATKLDYYLHQSVAVTSTGCTGDSRLQVSLAVTLSSDAPSSGLPAYVRGSGGTSVTRTNVFVFSPTGGRIISVTNNAVPARFRGYHAYGRSVAGLTVDLAPGESTTLRVTMLSGPLEQRATAIGLRTTPTAHASKLSVGEPARCGG